MKPKGPVPVLDLIPLEREALLAVLRGLSAEQWEAPTVCTGWSVRDLASHLLADDLGKLSGGRDGYRSPHSPFRAEMRWDELVGAINNHNESWVAAARRLSPNIVTELLAWTGGQLAAYFRELDLIALGSSVSWAGPDRAPKWLDVAREYAERWMHQEQIREAVGARGLREPRLFGPVLSTFVHALPYTYRGVEAEEGTEVRVVITGEAGGTWSLVRQSGKWGLFEDVSGSAQAVVTLSEDTAWRLFTKGLEPTAAEALVQRDGVEELGRPFLSAVGIIA